MFDRILIPLDGSSLAECVLPHALAIAKTHSPQVILLRVLDPLDIETRPRTVDPFDWSIRKVEAETYMKEISDRLAESGLKSDVFVLEGKAADMVIEFAHEQDVDLILLSSHGQSGISSWNVSSVVQKIILRVHTSIMLIRAYQPVPADSEVHYRRILLPLDSSQRAESVIQIAGQLAQSQGAEVLVAHVVKRPEMPSRTPLSQEDLDLVENIVERNRMAASSYLSELANRLDMAIETRLFVSDNVALTLHQMIAENEIDLVMLTAHGLTGETKWPYGSLVISFIAYGAVPLLVYQDIARENMESTQAEEAAQEHGER